MKAAAISMTYMRPIAYAFSVVAVLALAACASNDAGSYNQGPVLGAMTPPSTDDTVPPDGSNTVVANAPAPAQVVSNGVENLDISSFVDPAGFRSLSENAKTQASSAQYFALQFGRVGAARTWTGDSNVTGQISVGPYVKVNNRDCRDFTNIVNVGAKSYTKRGTACRGDDGRWAVGIAGAPSGAPALTPSSTGAAG
ncbi:MAG TPA: hypothetical protein VL418_11650 [Devosiaceae bacterium]|nr:hypothetical protein [Devosiaceae bacterium]